MREFLVYARNLGDLAPSYDECGNVCGETEKVRSGFCDICPVKEIKDGFREDAESELTERLGESWRAYSFESLYDQVLSAQTLERRGGTLTYKAAWFVEIIDEERRRVERIDDYNEMLKRKAAQQ